LKVIAKPALIHWAAKEAARAALADPTLEEQQAVAKIYEKRDAAGSIGSTIHSFLEAYTTGASVETDSLPPAMRGYGEAFKGFVTDFRPIILEKEKTIFSDIHKYAGTLDALMKSPGGTAGLMDFKTSSGVYREYGLQLAAYKQAAEEMKLIDKIEKTAVIHLSPEGKYSLIETKEPLEIFIHAKRLWEWWSNEK